MIEIWFKIGNRDPFLYEADRDVYISHLKEIVKTKCTNSFDKIDADKIIIKDNEGNSFNSIYQISECIGYGTKFTPFCIDEPPSVSNDIISMGTDYAVMHNLTITASQLKGGNFLSHIALPVGPECFHPWRRFVDEIVQDSQITYELSDPKCNDVYNQLRYWYGISDYAEPSKSDKHFCRHNLEVIMHHITMIAGQRFNKVNANEVSSHITFQFAKKSSLLEPVIFCYDNCTYYPLIASEAKGLTASLFDCYSQSISLACDLAVNLAEKFPHLKYNEIIVPFVITCPNWFCLLNKSYVPLCCYSFNSSQFI